MTLNLSGVIISLILFYLFETDGLFEYCKFLKIPLPYKNEYQKILDSGGSGQYLRFLHGIYKSFLGRAISCPICLSFYLAILFSAATLSIYNYPFIHFLALSGYFFLKLLNKFSS